MTINGKPQTAASILALALPKPKASRNHARQFCDCGQPATVSRFTGDICPRCARLEAGRRADAEPRALKP